MNRLLPAVSLLVTLFVADRLPAQSWTFLGPAPISNGQVSPIGPASGAIRSILVHPTNNDTYYVGSINGGVWRTTNSGSGWTALTDNVGSTSIGGLAFDPTSGGNTLVAGFGRFSSYGRDGAPRAGLIYSTDGGDSWTNLSNFSAGPNVSGVAARNLTGPGSGTIVVSVDVADVNNYSNLGIYRSTNGGNSFTRLNGATGSGLPSNLSMYGLFENRTDNNQLFTATRYASDSNNQGIYRSNDAGATWTRTSNATMNSQLAGNAGSGNAVVTASGAFAFAGIVGSNGRLQSLWRSSDGGENWAQYGGSLPDTNPGGQGWIHFQMLIDPTDQTGNRLYLTGDATQTSPYNGRVFRLDWGAQVTTNLFANGTDAPHADGRALAIRPDTGMLIHGSDGGLATLANPLGSINDTGNTWNYAANGNLGVMEVHRVAFDPVSRKAFGGTQDNGSIRQTATGGQVWAQTVGGDGGDVAVVRNPSNTSQSIRYGSYQYFGGINRRIYDANGNQVSVQSPSLTVSGTGQSLYTYENTNGNGIQFYGPMSTNRADGERLYLGTRRVYESTDRGNNLTVLKDFGSSLRVGVIKADGFTGSTPKPEVLYVSAGNQLWYRPDTGGALTQRTAYSGSGIGAITDLALQPRDWQHVVIADDNQVFRSTNAVESMVDITGDLLTAHGGVQRVYAVETFHVGPDGPEGLDVYLAGGRDGVYVSRGDGLGTWTRLGVGLPTALVTDMDYDYETDSLIVASLGRGVWVVNDVSTYFPIPEPASLLFILAPLLGVGALVRRRRAALTAA